MTSQGPSSAVMVRDPRMIEHSRVWSLLNRAPGHGSRLHTPEVRASNTPFWARPSGPGDTRWRMPRGRVGRRRGPGSGRSDDGRAGRSGEATGWGQAGRRRFVEAIRRPPATTTAAATLSPSTGRSDGWGEGRTIRRDTGATTAGVPRSAEFADPAPGADEADDRSAHDTTDPPPT